jgi:hypothetical protein
MLGRKVRAQFDDDTALRGFHDDRVFGISGHRHAPFYRKAK